MSRKDCIKNERKNLLDISADDFEVPVNFKKFKNSAKVQMPMNACKVKKSSKKKQITLHQMVKQNFKYSDVNPEHLQMALALSKSISDCQTDEVNDVTPSDYDDNKNGKKQTLLEFGFKYNKNKLTSENKIIKKGKDTWRTNKKSKFRFITPILNLRTDEDRESLIQTKISLILTENAQKNFCGNQELGSSHIMSEELMKINCSDCCIFRLNYKLNEFSRTSFSVPDLITVGNRTKCGYLLKDWKSIPLREHSPDITKTYNEESNKLGKEIQIYPDENVKDYESNITGTTIKKLSPQKTEHLASVIHEKVESSDTSINKELVTNTEYKENMYLISSPDLFEDHNSLILTNTSITDNISNKQQRSWKKLFSEDTTSETLILPDDTSVKNSVSKANICDPYNMNSQISETIMISSSSDEEDIMKNNSSLKKHLDYTENTSLSYSINNLGTECAVPFDNVGKQCNVNSSEWNFVGNISKLDKDVSISSSDKYEKSLETSINMGNTSNESYKLPISTLSDSEVCRKEDNVKVFQPISESYKECTSLNVTEHIEKILGQTDSPFNSIYISDDEATTSHNEQPESRGRIPQSSDLQHSSKEKNQTFKWNSDLHYFNKNLYSPMLNVCLSDEDNYSSNMKTNEKPYIFEDMEIMNEKQIVSHSHTTPLKRYSSFNESRTEKTTPSFGRYKSESNITPKNEFIVKTQNITPMIDYNQLDTPSIVRELGKYGLKPLKRKRGVNLLKHIYEATHPIVESSGENVDADKKKIKKWKNNKGENVLQDSESISDNQFQKCHPVEPWMETISESDLIFERQRSSKIPGCQIPLQIVWHNFLVQNPEIRENILLYEPLQVNVISSMLKEEGFKFHIQDLITFLDRKCITIKI